METLCLFKPFSPLLFQGVRDQLYLCPAVSEKHSESQTAYFGVLGFTKPVEELEFWTVPLQTILFWLSKPLGANLLEPQALAPGLGSAVPYRALAIAVTREMLYGEGGPLEGIGVVYKPAYILTLGYITAYMRLNEWHSAEIVRRPKAAWRGCASSL